jgi:hypothetical protein
VTNSVSGVFALSVPAFEGLTYAKYAIKFYLIPYYLDLN